jgi:hypothetical protein
MAAGTHERGDGEEQRRLSARGRNRGDPAFERRHPLLEHRHGRIRDARVDVPGALQVEQRRGVIGVREEIGGGLVDRHGAGVHHRIGLLPGVQGQRVEAQEFGIGHRGVSRRLRPDALWSQERHLDASAEQHRSSGTAPGPHGRPAASVRESQKSAERVAGPSPRRSRHHPLRSPNRGDANGCRAPRRPEAVDGGTGRSRRDAGNMSRPAPGHIDLHQVRDIAPNPVRLSPARTRSDS